MATYSRFTIIPRLVTLDDGVTIISLPRVLVDLGEARRLEEDESDDDESTGSADDDELMSEETIWDLADKMYWVTVSVDTTLNPAPAA
jgi:hypothetical protein